MLTNSVNDAVQALQAGALVAIPTETVYGLAAPIGNALSIANIFKLKQRPFFDPLIVHVSSIEMAKTLSEVWSTTAQSLAENFWPGPLSLVVPKNSKVSDMISSGLTTVAIRVPKHPLTLKLIEQIGPLAAPSANLFGRTSPTEAKHVSESLGEGILVLDGGPCAGGIESTVFDTENLCILRPGLATREQLEAVLGQTLKQKASKKSPGHLEHHYMPNAPLVIADVEVAEEKIKAALSAKTSVNYSDFSCKRIQLSTDATLAARELYGVLRATDQSNCILILQTPPSTGGLWEAIWDRLSRAATLVI